VSKPALSPRPPIANEDRLPDDRAVWREPPCPPGTPRHLPVTVEYAGGLREKCFVETPPWDRVTRYRFGWAPHPPRNPFEGLGLAAKE
jgi:hypothetical protein